MASGERPPAALALPNNINTIIQRDGFGQDRHIAYYDSDSGLFLGAGVDQQVSATRFTALLCANSRATRRWQAVSGNR